MINAMSREAIILGRQSCNNCLRGIQININNDILCLIKGPVSSDFFCKSFKMIPSREITNEKIYKCIDCSHFIKHVDLHTQTQNAIGNCHLFTVRTFDGGERRACSKLVKHD